MAGASLGDDRAFDGHGHLIVALSVTNLRVS